MPIQSYIEKTLNENDKVLIFDDRNEKLNTTKNKLLARLDSLSDKNTLVVGMKKAYAKTCRHYRQILESDYNFILELFRTYEFTDALRIISPCAQHGSMLNYINMGVLSEDEYIEALLY